MSRVAGEERVSQHPVTSLGVPATTTRLHIPPPSRSDGGSPFQVAVAMYLFLVVAAIALSTLLATQNPAVVDLITQPSASRLRATGLILLDTLNEEPRFAIVPVSSDGLPICDGVEERYVRPLGLAFGLMRGTANGRDLYNTLVSHDVCVAVKDIPYNGGYATSWRSASGEWFHGTITLDDDYVRSRQADVLAAMLIHEATHINRAINGESCDDRTDCETLPNGVELDEEVAAHAAEAVWWIVAYGEDGKRFAFGADYGENRLASAYQDGEAAFREYVRELRSDPKEGAGI